MPDDIWAAAPPVSLDGIEASITGIEGDLIELHNNVRDVKGDVVRTNQDLQALAQDQIRQDERLDALEAQDQDGGDYLLGSGDQMSGVLDMDATTSPMSRTRPATRTQPTAVM